MSYDPLVQDFQVGANLWPLELSEAPLAVGNTRTADFGPGPFPGSRSTRFVLAGDNEGVNTGFLVLSGRTDGAMFGLAVWLKGTGTLEMRMRAVGTASGVTEVVGTLAVTLDSVWRRYILRDYVAQFDCSSLIAEIRATGSGATVEAYGVDLRLLRDFTNFPEYNKPNGYAQRVSIDYRLTTTASAWSDSTWRTSSTPLAANLKGSKVYNGGVGGETSSEVLTRVIATTDAAKLHRSYGVNIIGCGNNNITDIDSGQLIADIDAMLAAFPHDRTLILPVVPGSAAAPGQGSYPYVLRAFRKFKSRYGRRFVDTWAPLCGDNGFSLACYRDDHTHLNYQGCALVADEVMKAMIRNGWIDGGGFDAGEQDDERQVHTLCQYTIVPAAVSTGNVILPPGSRQGFSVYNDTTTGVLYLSFGTYASGSTFFAKINPQGRETFMGKYAGAVTGYWSVADGNARVTEFL